VRQLISNQACELVRTNFLVCFEIPHGKEDHRIINQSNDYSMVRSFKGKIDLIRRDEVHFFITEALFRWL
jgi:hypothetical protein